MTLLDEPRPTAAFDIEGQPPLVSVRTHGLLDSDAVLAFEAAITTAVDAGATSVCIDLRDVTELEPRFVPALLRARERVPHLWCDAAPPRVDAVLRATGAALVLGIRRH